MLNVYYSLLNRDIPKITLENIKEFKRNSSQMSQTIITTSFTIYIIFM